MVERLRISGALFFWGLLLLGLFLASRYSYLLFQSIAEFFSVVIASCVFVIAWNTRRFQQNNYLLFLGIAYLFVGALDLLYTLSSQGAGVFPGAGRQLPALLWRAARTLESISWFLAPQFIGRRLRPYAILSAYLLAFITILLMIFVWRLVPHEMVAAGPVLTALQKTGEFINSLILLGAMALLWRQQGEFDLGVLHLLLAALALTIASELTFTFMAGVSTQAGLVGHLLKIASFCLIYRALIATELVKPYDRLFHNLRLSAAMARQEKDFADRLIEMAQVIVLVLDGEGRVLRLNHRCEAITGYALTEVKNRPFWEVFPAPEEMAEVQQAFFDLISGDFSQSWQVDWLAKDGTRHLIAWSNKAFPREDGSVEYVIGTGIDISEHREVEKRLQLLNGRLEQQIHQEPEIPRDVPTTQQDVESFADALWQDFRAPVRWLNGYSLALEEHSAPRLDVKGRAYLERMHGVIRQLEALLEAMQDHDRLVRIKIRRDETDLSLQARLIAAGLKLSAPARRVEFMIETGLTATGDPNMLRLALKILLGNAWKFTEEVPQAKIEVGALPAKICRNGFFVRDNRTDFGIHYGHRLFRSLQRMHTIRDFSGSDLSLATVRNIILQHGGRIWAEGAMGQGVTFYFTLPKPPPGIDRKTAQGD